ncbi:MAG: cytochrome C assembly protein, partial [Deferribacterales bacterium]|nr:cytochrome C assembly protein [Deferribacterales bacterium]
VLQKGGGGLHPDMITSLIVSVIAFTFLYLMLMNKNLKIKALERKILTIENE